MRKDPLSDINGNIFMWLCDMERERQEALNEETTNQWDRDAGDNGWNLPEK